MVVIFDDKIQTIAKTEDVDLSAYEVIDAGGNFIAPGLVDLHIHGYLGANLSDGYTNAAKVIADEIGSIEIGKRADIIIADDNFNVLMTILDGEIRYKGE